MTCNVLVQVGTVDGLGYDGQQEDAICDVRGLCMTNDSKHIQASLLLIPTDWLCLLVAQMPRSRDLAIFVVTTDGQVDKQTDRLLYPCACARGNYTHKI